MLKRTFNVSYAVIVGHIEFLKGSPNVSGDESLVTIADGMSLSYKDTDRFEIRGKLF
jgi:hypothetical protein